MRFDLSGLVHHYLRMGRMRINQWTPILLRSHCRNYGVCQFVRAKLLRSQALPPLVGSGNAFGHSFQSTTFSTVVFDSVIAMGEPAYGTHLRRESNFPRQPRPDPE